MNMNKGVKSENISSWKYYLAILKNTILLFALFMLTRIVFVCYNAKYFTSINQNDWLLLIKGALQFDLSGILYVNLLYILLAFFPLPVSWRKEK